MRRLRGAVPGKTRWPEENSQGLVFTTASRFHVSADADHLVFNQKSNDGRRTF